MPTGCRVASSPYSPHSTCEVSAGSCGNACPCSSPHSSASTWPRAACDPLDPRRRAARHLRRSSTCAAVASACSPVRLPRPLLTRMALLDRKRAPSFHMCAEASSRPRAHSCSSPSSPACYRLPADPRVQHGRVRLPANYGDCSSSVAPSTAGVSSTPALATMRRLRAIPRGVPDRGRNRLPGNRAARALLRHDGRVPAYASTMALLAILFVAFMLSPSATRPSKQVPSIADRSHSPSSCYHHRFFCPTWVGSGIFQDRLSEQLRLPADVFSSSLHDESLPLEDKDGLRIYRLPTKNLCSNSVTFF